MTGSLLTCHHRWMRDRQTDRQRQGAGRTAARGPTPAVPAGASREPARTESGHAAMSCRPPPPADAPLWTERKARAEGRFRRPSAPCLPCEESPGTKAENLKPTDAAFGTPGGSRARGQDARSRRGPGAGSRGPLCHTAPTSPRAPAAGGPHETWRSFKRRCRPHPDKSWHNNLSFSGERESKGAESAGPSTAPGTGDHSSPRVPAPMAGSPLTSENTSHARGSLRLNTQKAGFASPAG